MSFHELGLIKPIVRAVADQGYETPTPIQEQSIPEAIAGRDILGCAQTGTGKTCAFALPILHRLANASNYGKLQRGRAPRALILAPTRELATQIFESFVTYGRHLNLRHTVVYGGVNQMRQVRAMRDGVDVLVATPGRLLDLINQGHIDLRKVEMLVLDEADRMLDMGFLPDIRKIVGMVPKEHQTLFFSATVSKEIRKLSDAILDNPVSIETARESTTVDAITQRMHKVNPENKAKLLAHLLLQDGVGRALVFTRTKHGADKLVKVLDRAGIDAGAIHGNKSQNARNRAMKAFKSGMMPVLVATDVASRGIDVDDITHVINFDMPEDAETYVHRIGRTARAGATGIALSFCTRGDMSLLRAIERRTRVQIEVAEYISELPEMPVAEVRHEAPKPKLTPKGMPRAKNGGPRKNFSHGGKKKAVRKQARRAR